MLSGTVMFSGIPVRVERVGSARKKMPDMETQAA